MRPRVFPAEDPLDGADEGHELVCFNEAAGIPRGRHAADAARPVQRLDAGFNEAAGIPRGRPRSVARGLPASRRFNEAAGIPRGRPEELIDDICCELAASMRPRVFPAEDRREGSILLASFHVASMRPRVFPAEDAPSPSGALGVDPLQ